MSEQPLRIALVAEGETDKAVIGAAIEALVAGRSYVLRLLQPETSLPLEPAGPFGGQTGGGWGGVYKWCRGTVRDNEGRLGDHPLFVEYDILILHLDADVAGKRYSDCRITDHPADDLPCEESCPPPEATTNRLRQVLLRWCGETDVPPMTVLCTPSKSTETWVMAALFPNDAMDGKNWECHPNPEGRLSAQPVDDRVRKSKAEYQAKQPDITAAWNRLRQDLSEAGRFSTDFLNAVAARP